MSITKVAALTILTFFLFIGLVTADVIPGDIGGSSSGYEGLPSVEPYFDPNAYIPESRGHVVFHSYTNGTHTFSGEMPYFHQDGFCQYDGTATATVGGTIGNETITISFSMHGTEPTESGMCPSIGIILPYSLSVKASGKARVMPQGKLNGGALALDVQSGTYISPWGENGPGDETCREIISEDGLSVGCEIVAADSGANNPPCCKDASPMAFIDFFAGLTEGVNVPNATPAPIAGFGTAKATGGATLSIWQRLLEFFVFWK